MQQVVCRFREPPDAERLERAWRCVVARHDILRTRFRWKDVPEPVQEVVARVRWRSRAATARGWCLPSREEAVEGYLAEDRARGFDLAEAPAMRLALFQGPADEHVLVWSFHHMLLDAWSITRVLGEALALYDADVEGAEAALPVPRPFGDHVRWLRERDGAADEAYWTGVFEGLEAPAPVRPIRGAAPRPARRAALRRARDPPSPAADAALRALKRDRGVFVNTVVQGAWALLLGRYTGRTEAVFGTVRHGRAAGLEGAEGMVGLLINTVPIRVSLPPEARVVDWLREIAARNGPWAPTSTLPCQTSSGGAASRRVPPSSTRSSTTSRCRSKPPSGERRGGASSCASSRHTRWRWGWTPRRRSARASTTTPTSSTPRRWTGCWATSPACWRRWRPIPSARWGRWTCSGEAERALVLEEWNRTEAEYPADRCIHELFEAQAARAPDAVAVGSRGRPRLRRAERAGEPAGAPSRRTRRGAGDAGGDLPGAGARR